MKTGMVLVMIGMLAGTLGIAHQTRAADVDFTVGGGSTVSAYPYGGDTQTGLGIRVDIVAPPPAAFGLDGGDPPYYFDFFEIWTHEGTFETSNDDVPHTITATLDLSPPVAPVVFTGVTVASDVGGAHGEVVWDDDGIVTVDLGSCTYTVQLNDAIFNQGTATGNGAPFGGTGGSGHYDGYGGMAVIQACVALECDGEEVIPEPATLSLLAVGALGLLRRRRRK